MDRVEFSGDRTIAGLMDFVLSHNITILPETSQHEEQRERVLVTPKRSKLSDTIQRRTELANELSSLASLESMVAVVKIVDTEAEFWKTVNVSNPSLVYFHTPWCWRCRYTEKTWKALSAIVSFTGITVVDVDCSGKGVEVCNALNITTYRGLPVYLVMDRFDVKSRYVGPIALTPLLAFVQEVTDITPTVTNKEAEWLKQPKNQFSEMPPWWDDRSFNNSKLINGEQFQKLIHQSDATVAYLFTRNHASAQAHSRLLDQSADLLSAVSSNVKFVRLDVSLGVGGGGRATVLKNGIKRLPAFVACGGGEIRVIRESTTPQSLAENILVEIGELAVTQPSGNLTLVDDAMNEEEPVASWFWWFFGMISVVVLCGVVALFERSSRNQFTKRR
eukprot:c6433_g1_i1.p1 GENE.c6433_g1_i1~~c6433_g1_i1.p1  ORF type:complete len:390 (-),score=91.18 c6433_g1_i1:49-1218(-)